MPSRSPRAPRWWLRTLIFVSLIGLAALPWTGLDSGFSRAFSAIGNVCLGALSVLPVELELVPVAPASERGALENVQADTMLSLYAPGQTQAARLGLSLRRDAYLPLAIFIAATLVLPLSARTRLTCLALGVPLILAVALASIVALVLFLLSHAPGASIVAWQTELSGFVFDCWLTPPGNRVIAPLLLAAALGVSARAAAGRVLRSRVAATS